MITQTVTASDYESVVEPTLEVLGWASRRFGPKLTMATGFGPEGCALIDLIGRNALPIDIFVLDTGLLFGETRDLWRQLEERYGLTIRAVRPDHTVEEQARIHGPNLWERNPDQCCEMRKVAPLRNALAGFDAWITGIRADQTAARATAGVVEWDSKFGLVKVNPLLSWTSADVWRHLATNDVPHNPLHAQGYPSIGCTPCTTAIRPGEDLRAGRWRGREKTECGLHVRAADAHGERRRTGYDSVPLAQGPRLIALTQASMCE